LIQRLEQQRAPLALLRRHLPHTSEGAEAHAMHELALQSLQQFVTSAHTEWHQALDQGAGRHLNAPLLIQDKAAGA
jgi:hypothetical protein